MENEFFDGNDSPLTDVLLELTIGGGAGAETGAAVGAEEGGGSVYTEAVLVATWVWLEKVVTTGAGNCEA